MARCFLSVHCPGLAGDRLTRLVEWCDRYSPLVAQDGSDGVILDIAGCAHLFGGEGPLLLDLKRHLQRMEIASRAAIADTWGAAWALARHSRKSILHGEIAAAELDSLPVEALRLPAEVVLELRRLGLTTIAAVRKVPRRSLAARFGDSLLRRIDQVFDEAEDPLTPWRPPAAYRASRILAEPVSNISSVEYVLRDLLQEICARLEKNHLGSRHMDLACYRVNGTVDRCEVRTSKPNRAIPHLMRLFRDRLEKLWADFGFESFVLSVPDVEALHPTQLGFSEAGAAEDEESFDALVDRLGMKLGFHEVNRIQVYESYLPEHAVGLRSAVSTAMASAEWPVYRVRPLRLIDPPMPIQVSILIPGGSPVQFLMGQEKHRVVRSEGPERLTAEWWREPNSRWTTRDYYRIEDDRGLRFWIFCDSAGHWFLHGHFA
jgi:protein ImuB